MKRFILIFAILLFLFSVSSWARMPEATNQFGKTETTLPKIVKSKARPTIPEGVTPRNMTNFRKFPTDENYQPERSRAGGVATLFEDDYETAGDFWYYAGANYIFHLPDQYGDTEFGNRYTITHTSADLEGAWFYWYSDLGAPNATVHVYDVVANYPGTELGSVPVLYSNISIGGWTFVDLSSLLLSFDCGEEFFITYTVDGGQYGVTELNIITDDGSSGANRSIEYWGAWEYMYIDWGTDYEFCIDASVSYPDTWTSALGKWTYFTDPVVRDDDSTSHSPTHCWWADEEPGGGFKDFLKSPVFMFDPDSNYPLCNLSLWMNIEHLRAGAGSGFIDETIEVWMTDTDETVIDYWHIDSFNGYNSTDSWWCGLTDPLWAGGWGYGTSWDQWVQTPVISLPVGVSYLDFMHRYDVETDYDYCYVEISTNNWASYDVLATFNGTSNTWAAATQIDLGTTYSGLDVSIRFRFESDGGWDDEQGDDTEGAWFIDDVSVHDGSRTVYFEDDADTNQNFLVNAGNYEWARLFYDYDRDYENPGEHNWELVDGSTIFNGDLNVTAYQGKNVQMQIAVQVDDSLYAHGDGLWIDDISIEGIDLPEFDIQTDHLVVPYPQTEGLTRALLDTKIIYHQAGFGTSSTDGKCDVEGLGVAYPAGDYSGLGLSGVALGEYAIGNLDQFIGYSPEAGTYNFLGWCNGAYEERADSFAPDVLVDIYPPGEYELGYNSRIDGQYYFPGCTGAVIYHSPFSDGIFTGSHDITGINMENYNRFIPTGTITDTLQWATLTFKVHAAADSVTLGALLYEEEIWIPSTARSGWVSFPFTTPVTVTADYFLHVTGDFIDGNTAATEPQYFILADDNSEKFLGESYYSGHSFNYGIARDSLELYVNDYWINTLINVDDIPLPGYCENLTIAVSGNDIVLDWKAMPNALDYKVYFADVPGGSYTELTVTTGGASTYTHVGGAVDNKYFYKVVGTQ